jgi:hypothetical protein
LIVKLLNLLGAYFGLVKCHFLPFQEGEWLGFKIVSRDELFRVLDKKMGKVLAALKIFLESKTTRALGSWQPWRKSSSPCPLPCCRPCSIRELCLKQSKGR